MLRRREFITLTQRRGRDFAKTYKQDWFLAIKQKAASRCRGHEGYLSLQKAPVIWGVVRHMGVHFLIRVEYCVLVWVGNIAEDDLIVCSALALWIAWLTRQALFVICATDISIKFLF
jgi:hypothetical protein